MVVKIFLFIFLFHLFLNLFSYSPYNTHEVLTEEIANFYNLTTNGRKLTLQEIEWMKKGAIEEDYPPRWIHHFYNPLNQEGWTGKRLGQLSKEEVLRRLTDAGVLVGKPVSSIDWARNIELQASWDKNYTWDIGITALALGNNQRAFETLGHILHLLEDLTVPEHTRDDAHPDIGIFKNIFPKLSDGSPYEDWAKEFTLKNYNKINLSKELIIKNEKPYFVSSLEEAFHALASFTNKNFFSPDTINDPEFLEPNINSLKAVYLKIGNNPRLYLVNKDGIPILHVKEEGSNYRYSIDEIVSRYIWEITTKELLKYGAGLIELFLKEAEDLKPDADIQEIYIYKRSLSQLKEKIVIWNIHQTSFVTQLTRFLNFLDKISYKSKIFYNNVISRISKEEKELEEPPKILTYDFLNEDSNFLPQELKEFTIEKLENKENKLTNENFVLGDKNLKEGKNVLSLKQSETEDLENEKNETAKISDQKIEVDQENDKSPKILKPIEISEENKKSDKVQESKDQVSNQITQSLRSFTGGAPLISNQTTKNKCDEFSKKDNFSKIIINAIKFEGESSKDEFIELYNPNDFEVDLTCWTLVKKTAGQGMADFSNLVSKNNFEGIIGPNSFFLITHPSSSYAKVGDLFYSSASYSFSKNNVIAILNPKGEIVDLVGFGDNENEIREFETKPFIFKKLNKEEFIERKNFKDNNNNFEDFWITKREPYNSKNKKYPSENFIELKDYNLDYFEIAPKNSKIYIDIKELNFPSSSQKFKNIIKFSTSIPEISLDLSYDGQEKFFIYDFCPPEGNYSAEIKIFDLSNELNFLISSTTFEVPDKFCDEVLSYKILFSEILIEGENSSDEFIELYNPNNFEVDLSGWKIVKKTKSGKEITILSNRTEPKLEGKIKPYGYFLISNSNSIFKDLADIVYEYSSSKAISRDNTLLLIDKTAREIDKVGWGESFDFETKPIQNPSKGYSLERKKSKNSDELSLNTTEKNFGNFYDSDNNEQDFVLQSNPNPENSQIVKEPNNKPRNFKIKNYLSDIDIDDKVLSWWFKARKENQIIKFTWEQPGILFATNSKYLISFKFSTTSDFSGFSESVKNYLNIDLPEIKDDNSLVEVEYNVCNLKSGYYRFFLEIEENGLKKEIVFYDFLRHPNLFPCPPESPKIIYSIYQENNRDFLKIFYEDGKDYDFIATDISLDTIYSNNFPKYSNFYIFKISTNPQNLLDDSKFFDNPDFLGFYPEDLDYREERFMIYDLTALEPGKTYYIGIKTFSPYDFMYYGITNKFFTNEPLEVCKSANIFDSAEKIPCFLDHNGYPYWGYLNSPWAQIEKIGNFYDPENHQTPIPTYQEKYKNNSAVLSLIDVLKAYPHLLSSTTLISFTVPERQYDLRNLKYLKIYKENNNLYLDLKAKEEIDKVHILTFYFQPLKEINFDWNPYGFYPRYKINTVYDLEINAHQLPGSVFQEIITKGCYNLSFSNRTLHIIYTGEVINEGCEGRCNYISSEKVTKVEILKNVDYDFENEVFLMGIFYDVGSYSAPTFGVYCVLGSFIEMFPIRFGVEYNFEE